MSQHSSALKNAQIQKWYKSFYIESVEKCFLHSIKILMTDQRAKTSNGTQNPIPRTATAGELLAVKNPASYTRACYPSHKVSDIAQ